MNAIQGHRAQSSFVQGIFTLLERVEYRRIESPEDLDAVGRLRATSYQKQNTLEGDLGESLIDDLDFSKNAQIFALYIDEKMASTVRLHRIDAENRQSISMEHFPDVLGCMLDRGMTFIDPSRFATDVNLIWQYPTLPYLTLRIAAMASVYFDVDMCLSCINDHAAAFYRKSFGSSELAPARRLYKVTDLVTLYGAKIEDIRERIETRFPYFMSEAMEQRLLFGKREDHAYPSLNVLPTAMRASQNFERVLSATKLSHPGA